MTEEALRKALGQEDPEEAANAAEKPQEGEPKQEPDKPQVTEESWREEQKEIAASRGWKPFEEFVESGGNPKDWVPADHFNLKGQFIGQLRDKDKQVEQMVEERVAGVKKLYDARISELQEKRKEAVESGDTKAFERIDKEINELQAPPPQKQGEDPAVQQWNQENPWILEVTPKASFARDVYAQQVMSGVAPAQALSVVDAEVKKHFPDNPAPSAGSVPASEKGKGSGGFKTKQKTVSMSDLTAEESKLWKAMGKDAWGGDESKFLKAVADARAAEEGGK